MTLRVRAVASRSRRRVVPAVWVAALVLLAAVGVARTAAASRPPAGRRVTVAVFGDSVVESLLVANFLHRGLVPQLSRALWSLGFAPGGVGLIPATTTRWHFGAVTKLGARSIPADSWVPIGVAYLPSDDGLSGYSAEAFSPLATATVVVNDPDVEILYTSSSAPCTFDVTSAGRTWMIDTYRHGPAIDTGTSITLPPGRHELTIHGPQCDLLLFDGVIAQRPVQPGQVQVEVDDLGHSAGFPSSHLGPRVQQALIDQRYDISVFLFGYVGEEVDGRWSLYVGGLTARAQIARKHGGACLIVQPAPAMVSESAVAMVSRLERAVARRAGCTYTTVLAHLWSSAAAAMRRGLVFADGIHPTAAGYELIVHALTPVVAQMVRDHVHP